MALNTGPLDWESSMLTRAEVFLTQNEQTVGTKTMYLMFLVLTVILRSLKFSCWYETCCETEFFDQKINFVGLS